jgi:glycosyltransferase involved in cell wall biosynthesis
VAGPLPLKIVVVCRLFSGFRASFAAGVWHPSGAPAIAKLLEALAASHHQVRIFVTAKESTPQDLGHHKAKITLDGLPVPMTLLPGESAVPTWLGRARWYLYELRQALTVLLYVWSFRPDVVYVDRGNLWTAAFVCWFSRAPVVFRIMGISANLLESVHRRSPHALLTRILRQAPFRLAICTLDGSGGELLVEKLFPHSKETHVLLNGVDRAPQPVSCPIELPIDRTIVVFVGRLEAIKGCDEFVRAFLTASRERPGRLYAVVVGDGSRKASIKTMIAAEDHSNSISLAGELTHDAIQGVLSRCDIYISLNRQGNLSNANLEAFVVGCCCILPEASDTGRDLETQRLLPRDTAYRVNSIDDVEEIASAIVYLHDHPEERRTRAQSTAAAAVKFLNWEQRIETEIELIASAADRSAAQ